jgi:hypothetical protein
MSVTVRALIEETKFRISGLEADLATAKRLLAMEPTGASDDHLGILTDIGCQLDLDQQILAELEAVAAEKGYDLQL